jgi:hypothetical protein
MHRHRTDAHLACNRRHRQPVIDVPFAEPLRVKVDVCRRSLTQVDAVKLGDEAQTSALVANVSYVVAVTASLAAVGLAVFAGVSE